MEKDLFYELVERYLAGTATPEERRIVEAWYAQLSAGDTGISRQEQDRVDTVLLQSIFEQIQPEIPAAVESPATRPVERPAVVADSRKFWFRYAVAAVFMLMLGATCWLLLPHAPTKPALATAPKTQRFKNDVSPASQGVTLDLGNDHTVRLDSMDNGTLSFANAAGMQKENDKLTYRPGGRQISHHTITTGKGNNYHLVLADSTEVWLDAESSLYFPTAFPGKDRQVAVTGQAYFEVHKDRLKPFRVQFQNQLVEVLGTHFNIDAHKTETRTTLLEGSVRISNAVNKSLMLVPGQQAGLSANGQLSLVADADIDEVMAWKNGLFRFNGASIKDIMLQLERWYDIKVMYTTDIEAVSLVARIKKSENLSTVLSLLEMTGQVRFAIDGNLVTVGGAKRSASK